MGKYVENFFQYIFEIRITLVIQSVNNECDWKTNLYKTLPSFLLPQYYSSKAESSQTLFWNDMKETPYLTFVIIEKLYPTPKISQTNLSRSFEYLLSLFVLFFFQPK